MIHDPPTGYLWWAVRLDFSGVWWVTADRSPARYIFELHTDHAADVNGGNRHAEHGVDQRAADDPVEQRFSGDPNAPREPVVSGAGR